MSRRAPVCRHRSNAAGPIARLFALILLVAAAMALTTTGFTASAAASPAPARFIDARVVRDTDSVTQLVLALSRPVDYRLSLAPEADRIIIELPMVRLTAPAMAFAVPRGHIARMGASDAGSDGMRVVVDLNGPARFGKSYFMKAADRRDYQLVVNLVSRPVASPRDTVDLPLPVPQLQPKPPPQRPALRSAAARQSEENGSAPKQPVLALALSPAAAELAPRLPHMVPAPRPAATQRRPAGRVVAPHVVVIDAGHGGKDPGAISPNGTYEKVITLAYAKEIRRQLMALGGYKVLFTRSRDVYIPLRDRVAIARKNGAEVFMSIHANITANPEISGLSVYTLSDQASDAEAAALADSENGVDHIGGVKLAGQTPEAANILIDVVKRQTMNRSIELASQLLSELQQTTPLLPNKPRRFAGFVVLKAADVPSVLVELGFLSNSADEKRLCDAAHRRRVAAGIAATVDRFFSGTQVARVP